MRPCRSGESSATCIRLIGASSAGGFVSSAPAACAKAAAGHIAPLCAACRMGDGTIKCGKRGATGGDASLVGLDLEQIVGMRTTHVVLAAAHLDHDPTNNRLRNLRSLCQRCHLIHDRLHHPQRRITYLLRRASGDLFLGPYMRQWLEH